MDIQSSSSSYPQYVMDTYANSNERHKYYDEYIQEHHQVNTWDSWVFYIYRIHIIDLNALGYIDPFCQPYQHSIW
jgi:hypothetical protein